MRQYSFLQEHLNIFLKVPSNKDSICSLDELDKINNIKDRIAYCRKYLTQISSGSGRMTFVFGEDKVLKVPYNMDGLLQTRNECLPKYQKYPCFTKVFKTGKKGNWIVCEKCHFVLERPGKENKKDPETLRVLKKFTGLDDFDYCCVVQCLIVHEVANRTMKFKSYYDDPDVMRWKKWGFDVDKCIKYVESGKWKSIPILKELYDFIQKEKVTWTEVADLVTPVNYGVVKRNGKDKLVVLDYGWCDKACRRKKWYKEDHPKEISFPKDEIEKLKKQKTFITTRVSDDYDKYHRGDVVITPWKVKYRIVKRVNIDNIKKHPYYNELTEEQKKFLSKYNKICVLWGEKI